MCGYEAHARNQRTKQTAPKATKTRSRLARGSHRSPPTAVPHTRTTRTCANPRTRSALCLGPRASLSPSAKKDLYAVLCVLTRRGARPPRRSACSRACRHRAAASPARQQVSKKVSEPYTAPLCWVGGPASRYCGAVYALWWLRVTVSACITYLLPLPQVWEEIGDAVGLPLKRAFRVRGGWGRGNGEAWA